MFLLVLAHPGSPGQRAIKVVVVMIEQDRCEGAIKCGCLSAETVLLGWCVCVCCREAVGLSGRSCWVGVCVCVAGRQLD